ncbi:MAG: hypothetical protein EOP54_12600 [Sphingobacteriales bacterium]|nr:MAG: hypothetical protein EOP54_12600 [Sphingobacteriales bacterium]
MNILIHPQPVGVPNEEHTEEQSVPVLDVQHNWQYAVYLLVAGAIGGNLEVGGLDMFEDAVEKRIFEALQDNACYMSIRAEFVRVKKGAASAFQFDLSNSPDLYLPLIVLATQATGTSVLSNINTVIENDPATWQLHFDSLLKLGLELKVQDGLLIIKGGTPLNTSVIDDLFDPALLTAVLLMSLNAEQPVTLHQAHLIDTLFPNMIDNLNQLLQLKIATV